MAKKPNKTQILNPVSFWVSMIDSKYFLLASSPVRISQISFWSCTFNFDPSIFPPAQSLDFTLQSSRLNTITVDGDAQIDVLVSLIVNNAAGKEERRKMRLAHKNKNMETKLTALRARVFGFMNLILFTSKNL